MSTQENGGGGDPIPEKKVLPQSIAGITGPHKPFVSIDWAKPSEGYSISPTPNYDDVLSMFTHNEALPPAVVFNPANLHIDAVDFDNTAVAQMLLNNKSKGKVLNVLHSPSEHPSLTGSSSADMILFKKMVEVQSLGFLPPSSGKVQTMPENMYPPKPKKVAVAMQTKNFQQQLEDQQDLTDLHQRKGRFTVPRHLIDSAPRVVMMLFGSMIVIGCNYDYATEAFYYTALCYGFEVVSTGGVIPEYDLIFDVDTETVTVSVVQSNINKYTP